MTRVLYVSATDCLGGAEASLFTLLSTIDRDAVEPHLAVPDLDADGECFERLSDLAASIDVPVHRLPLRRLKRAICPLSLMRMRRQCLDARRAMRDLSNTLRPDLIHANSAAASLQSDGARIITHLRDLRLPLLAGWLIGRRSALAIATSQAVAAMAHRVIGPRVRRVPNGVDLSRFEPGREGEIGTDPYILMIGNLVPWKRHRLFLEVMAEVRSRIPQVRGVIAGGDLFGEHPGHVNALKRHAADLGLAYAVQWRDHVPFAEMPHLIAGATVLVHPTDQEPFGRGVVEAMACASPVVAVDAAGPGELLASGGGVLVKAGDIRALATAVCRYLADPTKVQQDGQRGRAIVTEHYAADLSTRLVESVYRELAG